MCRCWTAGEKPAPTNHLLPAAAARVLPHWLPEACYARLPHPAQKMHAQVPEGHPVPSPLPQAAPLRALGPDHSGVCCWAGGLLHHRRLAAISAPLQRLPRSHRWAPSSMVSLPPAAPAAAAAAGPARHALLMRAPRLPRDLPPARQAGRPAAQVAWPCWGPQLNGRCACCRRCRRGWLAPNPRRVLPPHQRRLVQQSAPRHHALLS